MSRLERIVAQWGGLLMDGGRRALIPGPLHSPKDRSVSLLETEDGRILIHCFSPKDDWRAVRRALAENGLLDTNAEAEPRHRTPRRIVAQPASEDRIMRAQRIWNESQPIRCSAASVYLHNRAISHDLARSDALRFHPAMTSLDDRLRRPALVAAISDANGALQGVQVTLLTRHGTAKAPVPTPRRIIGRLMGGAVRLSDAGDALAVGEGVETMLSASTALHTPVWAALTSANLARFQPPPWVRRLLIVIDSDAAGRAAAAALRSRVEAAIDVEFVATPNGFNDWNDWARATSRR